MWPLRGTISIILSKEKSYVGPRNIGVDYIVGILLILFILILIILINLLLLLLFFALS